MCLLINAYPVGKFTLAAGDWKFGRYLAAVAALSSYSVPSRRAAKIENPVNPV